MKPKLETIKIKQGEASFKYFKQEVHSFEHYWHYHPEIELVYIKNGKGLRFTGDNIGNFESGELVLIGKNLPHNWVTDTKTDNSLDVAFVLQFSNNLFNNFPECNSLRQMFLQASCGIKFSKPKKTVIQAIEEMENSSAPKRLNILLDILIELESDINTETLSGVSFERNAPFFKHQSRVSEVTKYIIDNLEKPIALNEIASFQAMTPPSFCRWFKQAIGKSFVNYLTALRIEKACSFLIQSDFSISQIAYSTGFESLSNFNRQFKKLKKQSPSEYKKLYFSTKN